ncbi:prepilin-type N-terminal cleavage/methylation domain-containing protein [Shewanella sp. 10N.261.52.F9]|uniref:prepilin-type N-terminal cleavage/methylation domain-containing protein n=1 Tax=Shewanella sp. 10N.261.52.F9 TaxID=3229684 RepID=UPI00354EF724
MRAQNKPISGFTIIELVMVIVILAIIAVIALPKLLALGRDAQIAQLQNIASKVNAQSKMIYTKSAIENIHTLAGCSLFSKHPHCHRLFGEYYIEVGGTKVFVSNGYPLAPIKTNNIINNNYRSAFGLPKEEFLIARASLLSSTTAVIVPIKWQNKLADIRNRRFHCHIEYRQPTKQREYSVEVFSQDC